MYKYELHLPLLDAQDFVERLANLVDVKHI